MAQNAVFNIFRFDSKEDKAPHFEKFDVPWEEGMTVLSGLIHIQDRLDGSLAFRSSCRAGVCGSCAMHINGKYRLACETQVAHHCNYRVTVRPLAHLPVIKDLMVDMSAFWEKYEAVKPYIMSGVAAPEKEYPQDRDQRAKLTGIVDCILCGACNAACPMTGTDPDYLGPAAFTKAARFILDSRDNAYNERLEMVGGDHGVWRCHTVYACQEVCPKDVDPTGQIALLKRHIMKPERK